MPRANTLNQLTDFLHETIALSDFSLRQVAFSEQQDWIIKDGNLSHKTGGFLK